MHLHQIPHSRYGLERRNLAYGRQLGGDGSYGGRASDEIAYLVGCLEAHLPDRYQDQDHLGH